MKIIGCDLGTGNSCVSTIEGGKPVVINNSEGGRTTPSVVNLKNGERIVGPAANRKRVIEPKETVYNIKRFMGSDYDKCIDVVEKMAYDVVNENGNPRVKIGDRKYSPEEISSYILGKLKKDAEEYLGEEVTDAVITCPAWFDGAAREATKIAGEMCGLNVLRIINEPTAALLSSDIDTTKGEKTILVADIGQGTTDFSVCELSDGLIEVKASYGSKFLGGADFDQVIVDMITKDINEKYSIDVTKDPMAMQRIMEAAEKAKIELSNTVTTDIALPYISMTQNGPVNYSTELSRAKFDQLSSSLVTKIIDCGKKAVSDSGKKYSEIESILLVGGQSRSIAIQEALTKEFGVPLNKSVNPDEAVSLGAAIQANIIVGGEGSEDILLLDCTAVGIGILTEGNVMTTMIPANTTIPTQKSQIFSTAVDNQPGIEVVVLQGERPRGTDNKVIGRFSMDLLPAKRGVPQIEITYSIDASGIISVKAIDKGTNKEQNLTIENASKLSDEEIERIKREAKEHEDEDKKYKETIEKTNRCESLIYQTEQQLENFKDNEKITEDDKTYLTGKVEELKKLKEAKDFSRLEEIEKEVQTKWFEISSKVYSTPNGEGNNPMEDMVKNAGFDHQAGQQSTEEDLNQQEVG